MEEERGASFGTVFMSFLFGAAVGSGLALLFAPKSGREMREQLKDLSDDAVDRIKEYAKEAQEKIVTTFEEGKERVKEQKSILTSAYEAGKEAMAREKEKYTTGQREVEQPPSI